MVIIMLGAPGTGKGTVASILSKELTIYEKSPVIKLTKNEAFTQSNKISFNSVVVCTGYPFLKLKPYSKNKFFKTFSL